MSMKVLQPGAQSSVQDLGRKGYAALGYRECGACDKYAMQLANILAGNPRDTAVVEMTLTGGSFLMEQDAVIALTGADMQPVLDEQAVPMYEAVFVKAGQILKLGAAVRGLRCYLAVMGGIDVPKVMGSRSTDLRCGLGGADGKCLFRGEQLQIGKVDLSERILEERWQKAHRFWEKRVKKWDAWIRHCGTPMLSLDGKLIPVLRVVPGPQEERFTREARELFTCGFYTMQADSDRMGARFAGNVLEAMQGYDMISDGIVEGSVQVSGNGQPIVMLADHQTTGGYLKIGTVISADIPAAAQCRPGEKVAFGYVDTKEAVQALRSQAEKLAWIKESML